MGSHSIGSMMAALVLGALLVSGVSCTGYGNVGTVNDTVDANGARNVSASFAIGDGQIDLGGGADPLMRASFTTNDRRTPVVSYRVQDRTGTLAVTQSAKPSGFNVGPATNRWLVNLNDGIPVDLKVNSQSARLKLSLDTLTVRSLGASTDSGAMTVGLSGVQEQLSSVSIRSASGDLQLTMDGDYRAATNLQVDSSSGSVTADLSGKWSAKLTGTFKSDSGSITITVPKGEGVQLTASTDSGYVDTPGFTKRGRGIYVSNPAAATMLTLVVQTSSGNISVHQSS